MDLCLREKWDSLELGLFGGLAGIGLNLLHLGGTAREATFTELGLRIVDICSDRLGGPDDVPEISGGANPRAGLMYGSAGPALLFLHAYERTGDTALLDRAAVALRQDLRRCSSSEDGTLQVTQGWRTLPTWTRAPWASPWSSPATWPTARTRLSGPRSAPAGSSPRGDTSCSRGCSPAGRHGRDPGHGTGTRTARSRHRPGRADPRTRLARAALRRRAGLPRKPTVQAFHGLRDRHGRSPVRSEHRAE
ncbi:lanthionine synthetase LanC family protein [Streptosporangium lutulentum]